ncbi:MAG TPA: T9SS type A sorting domain-containing protein [Bacteroidia bacterium]|nr:T9SS type A sorting domain-containing protein [Bacteroidia bacterium]
MKKIYSLVLLLAAMAAQAQTNDQLRPNVIASSGGFFSNSAGMLSYTVGELAAVTTLSSLNNFLTQGFQQPSDFNVFVPSVDPQNFSMSVFPNPGNGNFYITIKTPKDYSMTYSVYDMLGKLVIASDKKIFRGNATFPLDLTHQIVGIYLLEIVFTDLRSGEQFKNYSKLNLIY